MQWKLPDLWKVLTPENVGRWLSAVGGRRFWLTMLTGAAASLLAWYAKISDEIYRDVTLGTVGAYIIGNTVQKVKQATSTTTVAVAEITGEAPVTNNIGTDGLPIKVELSTKDNTNIGY